MRHSKLRNLCILGFLSIMVIGLLLDSSNYQFNLKVIPAGITENLSPIKHGQLSVDYDTIYVTATQTETYGTVSNDPPLGMGADDDTSSNLLEAAYDVWSGVPVDIDTEAFGSSPAGWTLSSWTVSGGVAYADSAEARFMITEAYDLSSYDRAIVRFDFASYDANYIEAGDYSVVITYALGTSSTTSIPARTSTTLTAMSPIYQPTTYNAVTVRWSDTGAADAERLKVDNFDIDGEAYVTRYRFEAVFRFDSLTTDLNNATIYFDFAAALTGSDDLDFYIGTTTSPATEFASDKQTNFSVNIASYITATTMYIKIADDYRETDGTQSNCYIKRCYIVQDLDKLYDYVDAVSTEHSPSDIGTHSSFAAMQAYDQTNDTLTEGILGNPTYVGTGNGAESTAATCYPTFPTGLQSGDLLILAWLILEQAEEPVSATNFTAWLGPYLVDGTGTDDGRLWLYYRYSDGAETGRQTITKSATTAGQGGKIYAFRGVHQTIGNAIENVTWVNLGTTTTVLDTAVNTTGGLAVNLVAGCEDSNNPLVFSGQTGGTWIEVAEYEFASGNDGMLQLQYAYTFGVIDGGSYTWTSDPVGVLGFGLLPPSQIQFALDLEVKWTQANYDHSHTMINLSIYAGAQGAEALLVDVWDDDTSAWVNVIVNVTAESWNNVTVTDYVVDASFEIRFRSVNDTVMIDTWIIDAVLLTYGDFPPVAPVIDASSECTDIDDTDYLYGMYKNYTFTSEVSDGNGYANIDYVELSFQSGVPVILWTVKYTQSTSTFSESLDADNYITLQTVDCIADEAGSQIDITWKILVHWNHTDVSDYDLYTKVVDDEATSDDDTADVDYNVETRLDYSIGPYLTDGLGDSDRGNYNTIGGITATGTIIYYGSGNNYPLSSMVDVWCSSATVSGSPWNDTTLVSGVFSMAVDSDDEVTGSPTTYTFKIVEEGVGSGGTDLYYDTSETDLYFADRIQVLDYDESDTYDDIHDSVNIRVTLQYDYDNTPVINGAVTINGISASYSDFWWTISKTYDVPTQIVYDTVAASGNTYGITAVDQNGKSTTITWDDILVVGYIDNSTDNRDNINDYVNITVQLQYEYTSNPLTTGTVTINGVAATHIADGYWYIIVTSATVQAVTYNNVQCSGDTYQLTEENQNGQSFGMIWDALICYISPPTDQRINIGANATGMVIWAIYAYDSTASNGTLALNDTTYNYGVVGIYYYNVTTAHDNNTYHITVISNSGNYTYCIFDALTAYVSVPDDQRINIGANCTGLEIWAIYEYDSTPYDGGLTLNDTTYNYTVVGRYGYNVTIADGLDTYGITIISNNGNQTYCIFDALTAYVALPPDQRINIGANCSGLIIWATYDYDSTVYDGGLTLNDTTYNHGVVGIYYYNVTIANGLDTHGISVIMNTGNQTYCIFDALTCYVSPPTDQRIDINANASGMVIWAIYDYDSTPYDGSLTLNDTTYNYGVVDRYGYNVTFADGLDTYGISVIMNTGNQTYCIFDQIEVYDDGCDYYDIFGKINVGQNVTIWAKARLQYDNHEFGVGDYIEFGDERMTWNGTHLTASFTRWSVANWTFTLNITGSYEDTYGITVGTNTPVNLVFDRILIYDMWLNDTYINPGDTLEVWCSLVSEFDNESMQVGLVQINGTLSVESGGDINSTFVVISNWRNYTLISTFGEYVWLLTWANWTTYNITEINYNGWNVTLLTGYADRIIVMGYNSNSTDNRDNIFTYVNISVWLQYESDSTNVTDGTIFINGDQFLYLAGWNWTALFMNATASDAEWNLTVASGNTRGITEVNQNGQSIFYIWDSYTVTFTVGDNRININTNATVGYTVVSDYDSIAYDGTVNLNYSTWTQSSVQRQGFTVSSLSGDDTYSITAISTNDADYVIFDAICYEVDVIDNRINIGNTSRIWVNITWAYDNTNFTNLDGSATLNGSALTFSSGNGWYFDVFYTSVVGYYYVVDSITDGTYGITSLIDGFVFNGNVTANVGYLEYVVTDDFDIDSFSLSLWFYPESGHITNNADFMGLAFAFGTPAWSALSNTKWYLYIYNNSGTVEIYFDCAGKTGDGWFGGKIANFDDYCSWDLWNNIIITVATGGGNSVGNVWINNNHVKDDWDMGGYWDFNDGTMTYFYFGVGETGGVDLNGLFYGYMKDIKFYNTTLTDAQCAALYSLTYVDELYLEFGEQQSYQFVIWDSLTCYVSIPDDQRINIGVNCTGIEIWAIYNYDSNSYDGGLTLNDTTYDHGIVGIYYYNVTIADGLDAYGINVISNSGNYTYCIFDQVIVLGYISNSTDNRDNINTVVNVSVWIQYNYDDTNVTDGTIFINGDQFLYLANWTALFMNATASAATWNNIVCAGNIHGITSVNQNGQSYSYVWDSILIYDMWLNDTIIAPGGSVEVWVSLVSGYNNESITVGLVQLNGTLGIESPGNINMTWDSSSNWYNVTTIMIFGNYTFEITWANWTTYDITIIDYNGWNVTYLELGVDRIIILTTVATDGRIDYGTGTTINVTAKLEMLGHALDGSDGDTLWMNGTLMTWDIDHFYIVVGPFTTIDDFLYFINSTGAWENTYGVSVVNLDGNEATVIWDMVEVYQAYIYSGYGDRVDWDASGTPRFRLRLAYDGHLLNDGVNDAVSINGSVATWIVSYWRRAYVSWGNVIGYNFTVTSAYEDTYGISAFNTTSADEHYFQIIWDGYYIYDSGADQRFDIGAADGVTMWWKFASLYDGTTPTGAGDTDWLVYLNNAYVAYYNFTTDRCEYSIIAGTGWDAVYNWTWWPTHVWNDDFEVQHLGPGYGYYNTEGGDYNNSIASIADAVMFYIWLEDPVVDVGSGNTVWVNASYMYDGVDFTDAGGSSILLNGSPMTYYIDNLWYCNVSSLTAGVLMYTVSGYIDGVYGLTVIGEIASCRYGVADYVASISPDYTINVTSTDVTVSFWFYMSALSTTGTFGFFGNSTYSMYMNSTYDIIVSYNGGIVDFNTTDEFNLIEAKHIMIVFTSIDTRLYLNGTLYATAAAIGSTIDINGIYGGGTRAGNGTIYDFQIHECEFTAYEIWSIYSGYKNTTNLIMHFTQEGMTVDPASWIPTGTDSDFVWYDLTGTYNATMQENHPAVGVMGIIQTHAKYVYPWWEEIVIIVSTNMTWTVCTYYVNISYTGTYAVYGGAWTGYATIANTSLTTAGVIYYENVTKISVNNYTFYATAVTDPIFGIVVLFTNTVWCVWDNVTGSVIIAPGAEIGGNIPYTIFCYNLTWVYNGSFVDTAWDFMHIDNGTLVITVDSDGSGFLTPPMWMMVQPSTDDAWIYSSNATATITGRLYNFTWYTSADIIVAADMNIIVESDNMLKDTMVVSGTTNIDFDWTIYEENIPLAGETGTFTVVGDVDGWILEWDLTKTVGQHNYSILFNTTSSGWRWFNSSYYFSFDINIDPPEVKDTNIEVRGTTNIVATWWVYAEGSYDLQTGAIAPDTFSFFFTKKPTAGLHNYSIKFNVTTGHYIWKNGSYYVSGLVVSDTLYTFSTNYNFLSGTISLDCDYTVYENGTIVGPVALTAGSFAISWARNTTVGYYQWAVKFADVLSTRWVNGSYQILPDITGALAIMGMSYSDAGMNFSFYWNTNWGNTTGQFYFDNVVQGTAVNERTTLSFIKPTAVGDYNISVRIISGVTEIWINHTYSVADLGALYLVLFEIDVSNPENVTAMAVSSWANATIRLYENNILMDADIEGALLLYAKAIAIGNYSIALEIDGGASTLWVNTSSYEIPIVYDWSYISIYGPDAIGLDPLMFKIYVNDTRVWSLSPSFYNRTDYVYNITILNFLNETVSMNNYTWARFIDISVNIYTLFIYSQLEEEFIYFNLTSTAGATWRGYIPPRGYINIAIYASTDYTYAFTVITGGKAGTFGGVINIDADYGIIINGYNLMDIYRGIQNIGTGGDNEEAIYNALMSAYGGPLGQIQFFSWLSAILLFVGLYAVPYVNSKRGKEIDVEEIIRKGGGVTTSKTGPVPKQLKPYSFKPGPANPKFKGGKSKQRTADEMSDFIWGKLKKGHREM